ncbi:MAG TPA: response regulator [Pirellulales bacterium]|nr:response regulator [Pirellulales bacterium]
MSPPRVLVVDDDRSCAEIVAQLLRNRGCTVDVAGDGQAALELVALNSYSLIVLDYQMPGMDGVEVYRRAVELRPGLPALLVTAYPRIDVVFPAIDARFQRVLAKPVNAEELVPIVEQLIAQSHAT